MTTIRCIVLDCKNNLNKICIADVITIDEESKCWIFVNGLGKK